MGMPWRVLTLLAMGHALALASMACKAEHRSIDPDKLAITLTRSACYGSCPAYQVTIYADGRVRFTTKTEPVDAVDALHRQFAGARGVLLPGTHEDRVSPAAVAALAKQFEAADFWHLKDEYRSPVTDNPTQIVSLLSGTQRKSVIDYVGTEAGMPQAVRRLEEAIDRLAGTDRWVSGSPALIPWLERTGFPFHSTDAAELALAGEEQQAPEATILALIERGAPLDTPVIEDPLLQPAQTKPPAFGTELIQAALRRGHAKVFQRLVADGWLEHLGKPKAAAIFAEFAAGCSPALVDAVAAAGVSIDKPENLDAGSDLDPAQGKTALGELSSAYPCMDNASAQLKTAERLLALGANPNHRDSVGHTPLYGVENLALLNLLLAKGADATVKANDGESLVFGSWTDAIVLRLLQAGASPVGRYDDGKTLAQEAKARNMPMVARWLAAHPVMRK